MQVNEKTYRRMIQENISELEKHMPKHSLEKKAYHSNNGGFNKILLFSS